MEARLLEDGISLMNFIIGIGVLFLVLFVIDLISSAQRNAKEQERVRLELIAKGEFENWLHVNLEQLKKKSLENRREGKKYIEEFENALLEEARSNPIDFIYNYYSIYSNKALIGTKSVLQYSSDHGFENTLDFSNELFHTDNLLGKFNFYLTGVSLERSEVRNKLNNSLESILLARLSPESIQNAFYNKELSLYDFKEDVYSGYKGYTSKRYVQHGPFKWLRDAKYLNPSTLTRQFNNYKSVKRSHEIKRKHYDSKFVDNSTKFNKPESIRKNSIKDLNDHIEKNSYTSASNQPYVSKKSDDRIKDADPVAPAREYSREHSSSLDKSETYSTTNPLHPEYKEARDKHLKTKTQIYILHTPFQLGQMIEIKIGESTNLKTRIDDYRQYWRDKFHVVFISDGIVENEKELKNRLDSFHVSNEFFKVDLRTMQIISKSSNILELLKNLEIYSNVDA